jgi:hypothetical protein
MKTQVMKNKNLSEVEISIIAANLRDYADNLYAEAGWCGDKETELQLREDANESIELAKKLEK